METESLWTFISAEYSQDYLDEDSPEEPEDDTEEESNEGI